MRTKAPPLLAIFRSQLQGELLAEIFLGPDQRTITDLATRLVAPVSTVQREVTRLEQAGILRTERLGRGRVVMVDERNPAVRPLRELVEVTFGPRHVISDEFAALNGIEGLLVFGSWAARYQGLEGRLPGDVDVLIVGNPDRDEVYEAAERAQRRLHREVNTTVMDSDRWHGDEPFVQEIRRRPLIVLTGSGGNQ